MTPRERVLQAIDHREPDRVPVDLGSTMVSTLTREAYDRLRAWLGLEPDPQPVLSNRNLGSVAPAENLLAHYSIDCRGLRGVPVGFFNADTTEDGSAYTDEYGVTWRRLGSFWEAVRRQLQEDDLGMQTGLFISPEMYRRLIKPYHKRIFDTIHSRTPARLLFHCCGSVYDIIPDLIEIGVDILNPVQTGAARMDLAGLKRRFGHDLAFWGGGIDTQIELQRLGVREIE